MEELAVKKNTIQGSFLLEVLVAFAIISIALTVIVDTFVTSQRSYRNTVEQAELTRVVTRIMEDMTIQARVSEQFACGVTSSPCTQAGDGAVFAMTHIEGVNGQGAGEIVRYRLNGGAIEKNYLDEGFVRMTPPSIEITDFTVDVMGIYPDDQIQAILTLTAREAVNPVKEIHVQTSFTERRY